MDQSKDVNEKFIRLVNYKIGRTDGCSIHRLAKEIGMNYPTLQSNLCGKTTMSFPTAIKLALYFHIDMTSILFPQYERSEMEQDIFALTKDLEKDQKDALLKLLETIYDCVDCAKMGKRETKR